MEWTKESQELYNKFTSHLPLAFKPVVKPLIKKSAEKRSLDRNSTTVELADLITGLIDATPEQFYGGAISTLKDMGVEVEKYIKIREIRDENKLNWEAIGQAFHPGNYNFNLYITDKCNQNCVHCAVKQKKPRPELTTQQWKDIVDDLEGTLRKQNRHGVYIWFGGEPTTRADIKELIKYCGDKGYYQAIATNGILFDEEFAKFCADNHMSHVFVSLDSTDPDKVDKIRGAKGSFDIAVQAIKNAVKYGIFVIVSTTVMKDNLHEIDKVKKFAEELGATCFMRAVIRQKSAADNWQNVGLSEAEYRQFYEYRYGETIAEIAKGNAKVGPMCMTFDMVPFMDRIEDDKNLNAIEWGVGCQACRSISGIDINGDFFPCDYPSQLTLGNVLTDGTEKIMNSQLFKDIHDRKRVGKCAKCEHLSLCGGGCRVHAEVETGSFFESFNECWCKDFIE